MSSQAIFSIEEMFNGFNKYYLSHLRYRYKISLEDAEDILQAVWGRVIKKIREDQELYNQFKKVPEYFEKYMYKSLRNAAVNYYISKEKKDQIKLFSDLTYSNTEDDNNVKNTEISMKIKSKELQPDDILYNKQMRKIMKDYFDKLKEELKEEEIKLIDVLLEQLEKEGEINPSRAGRDLGIGADKAHNILNRIKRRIKKFDEKNKGLRDVSVSIAAFDFGLYDIFKDIFVPEEFDEEISAAGEKISKKILDQLGLDDLTRLSQIFK
jgi:DNA-directed RNA polymerase specialized sigma24 family protein